MKAAAPQAPGSAHHPAKASSKGRAVAAHRANGAAFAGVLATAVAAKARVAPASAPRGFVPPAAAARAANRTASVRGKSAGRDETRSAGQHRAEGAAVGLAEALRGQSAALAPAAAPLAETRAAAAPRRSEPRVQVVDLRKKPAAAEAPAIERAGPRSAPEAGDVVVAKPFSERLAAAKPAPISAPSARPTPLERIREMSGSDLVRSVGLVVRDGGGEIRLTLKPESLGSVRIRLSIEDGKIEGRIVVDTAEARQAFQAGIDSLTRALQADGFQTGSLQVSVSGGNANDSRQAAGLLGETIRGARLRASDEALQAAVPLAGWTGGGDGLVNVFA